MKKGVYLLTIFATFVISCLTLFLTLLYVDPYQHTFLGVPVLIFSFGASVATLLTLVLYFIKKIHYRGEVYIYHILTSFRQAFLIALYLIGLGIFLHLGVLKYSTVGLYTFLLIFLELFVWNLGRK